MDEYRKMLADNGVEISDEQFTLLSRFVAMMADENQKQNLTALHYKSEIWERHILDSAMILQHLPKNTHTIIDIGTGGGIPGIPLAILRPEIEVTLLDSELHKIEFCEAAVKSLGLHAKTVCGRAEELARADYRGRLDCAISRAMASGSMLCELAIPMLRVGGTLLAMKGRNYDPAIERFDESCKALGADVVDTIKYHVQGEQKHMIICRKICETPGQFPRRFAKIKRSPL